MFQPILTFSFSIKSLLNNVKIKKERAIINKMNKPSGITCWTEKKRINDGSKRYSLDIWKKPPKKAGMKIIILQCSL